MIVGDGPPDFHDRLCIVCTQALANENDASSVTEKTTTYASTEVTLLAAC